MLQGERPGRGGVRESRNVSQRVFAWVALGFFLQATAGCLSNEYVIPRDELRRQALLPAEMRGSHVRLVQALGERRSEPLPAPPPLIVSTGETAFDEEPHVVSVSPDVVIDLEGGGPGPRIAERGRTPSAPRSSHWQPAPAVRGTAMPNLGPGGSSSHGSGGGSSSGGGAGAGNDVGEVLAVMAVVAVTAAFVSAVALAASEGARFDGYAQIPLEQPVYLKVDSDERWAVRLGDLTPELAELTAEATVADDEGAGLRRLDRAPLDRRGGTYKLSLGTSAFNYQTSRLVGPAAQIQIGGFFTPKLGLLLDIGLSGATDCCTGATVVRHSVGLELQALPLTLGRFHLGAFAKGGMALVGGGVIESGPVADGGILAELDLATRLALTMRAGVSTAQLDSGWSQAAMLTVGIAVY
jgi:hypothetical protein